MEILLNLISTGPNLGRRGLESTWRSKKLGGAPHPQRSTAHHGQANAGAEKLFGLENSVRQARIHATGLLGRAAMGKSCNGL